MVAPTVLESYSMFIVDSVRENGSVQNFDEFGKAFSCKKGAPMYPENSCRVW